MKKEIDSSAKLTAWLDKPEPAIFQGLDLESDSVNIATKPLAGCSFFGCKLSTQLAEAAAKAGCFLIPRRTDMPFDPFRPTVYTPLELFDKMETTDGWKACLDYQIYKSYANTDTRKPLQVDAEVAVMRRLHDSAISDALEDFLDPETQKKTVAIMGGHDAKRTSEVFAKVANLALDLASAGYTVLTGGGPGLMEAGNVGAYCAGFSDAKNLLAATILKLKDSPAYDSPNWLPDAYKAWKEMGNPTTPGKSRNVGIPTWFYGHEPPNIFATHIAKYFENSVREEGLLAIALGGIIYAEGNGGTCQEIFQDANQNYYRTYAEVKSPMILFGKDYWNPGDTIRRHDPQEKRKNVYPILEKLATEKAFSDYLAITDDPATILKFIKEHPPVKG